jgi:hypothetical protein
MLGHPLDAGVGEVALGDHRHVRLHRLQRHVVAHHLTQPLDELRVVGLVLAAAGETGQRAAIQLVQDGRLPAGEDAGADRAHVREGQQVEHP